MGKTNHHFVAKFYLKGFLSKPGHLHLYSLKRQQAIQGANMRGECQRPHFHGEMEDVENAVMTLENASAPVLRDILSNSQLPAKGSKERGTLLAFVVLQTLRSARIADRTNASIDKMMKQAFRGTGGFEDEDWDLISIGVDHPALLSMSVLGPAMHSMMHLEMHLVCAGADQVFITSDNPTFKYNQYLQGVKTFGLTGSSQKGFQVFFPLSPKHLLMLYDGTVYRVGSSKRPEISQDLPNSDITKLNSMQVVSAGEKLYFNSWSDVVYVERVVRKSVAKRIEDPVRTKEFMDPNNDLHSFLHQYDEMPNLQLALSFVHIQDEAKRMPMHKRLGDNVYLYQGDPSRMQSDRTGLPEGTIFVPQTKSRFSRGG